MKKEQQNAQQEVRTWFAAKMAKQSIIKLPALVKQAVNHFIKDTGFLKRFFRDFMYRAFYNLAIAELHRARGPSDIQRTPLKLRPIKPSIWAKWEGHLEHVGTQYVSLPELTPTLWRVAREERLARCAAEERAVIFGDKLMVRCGPRQKMRHCWEPVEVDALWKALHPKEDVA